MLEYENEQSINNVCEALRRYLRRLSEPLFTNAHRKKFLDARMSNFIRKPRVICAADTQNRNLPTEMRVRAYESALSNLPHINYSTLRVLIGHLHDVCAQSSTNLASASNLAKVFGPTLMTVEGSHVSWVCVCLHFQICLFNLLTETQALLHIPLRSVSMWEISLIFVCL
jgi:hypothetical protein